MIKLTDEEFMSIAGDLCDDTGLFEKSMQRLVELGGNRRTGGKPTIEGEPDEKILYVMLKHIQAIPESTPLRTVALGPNGPVS